MTATLDITKDTDYSTGELAVLDRTGDVKLSWDTRNEDEVNAARKMFTRLKKAGHLAYKTSGNDDTTQNRNREVIHEFDPTAERIVMSPAIQGG